MFTHDLYRIVCILFRVQDTSFIFMINTDGLREDLYVWKQGLLKVIGKGKNAHNLKRVVFLAPKFVER